MGRAGKHKGKRTKTRSTVASSPPTWTAADLASLAEREPTKAASALLRIHQGNAKTSAGTTELAHAAIRVAGRLRRARSFDLAASVLAVAPREDPRVLVELAMLTFARGDDAALRALASRAGLPTVVTRVIQPLLAAVELRGIARAPRGASAALKSVCAATRCISDLAAGTPVSPSRTATMEEALRGPMDACITALCDPSLDARHYFESSTPDVVRLSQIAIAQRAPHQALRTRLNREAQWHAFVGLESAGTELLYALDAHDAFDRLERRGDGLLHLAFDALHANERRDALRLLDAAVAARADLRECARLRWRIADDELRANDRDPRAMRALEKASAAFERELAREPHVVASRVAVRVRLASARATHLGWMARAPSVELTRVEFDLAEVEGWVRDTWMDTPAVRGSIDRARARWHLARGEDDRARALVDAVLETDPTMRESWWLALEIAAPEERPDLERRAAEATGARIAPKHSSGTSAGALAERVLECSSDQLAQTLTEVASAARALPPRLRALLGMGIATILSSRELTRDGVKAFLGGWLDDPDAEPTWIAEVFLREGWEEALRVLRPYLPRVDTAHASDASAGLADLAVVAAAYESPFAQVLLGEAALPLTPNELSRLRARMRRPHTDAAFRHAEARADEAHDALHPEVCLASLEDEPGDEDDESSPTLGNLHDILGPAARSRTTMKAMLELVDDAAIDAQVRSMLVTFEFPPELAAKAPRAAKLDFLASALTLGPEAPDTTIQRLISTLSSSTRGSGSGDRRPAPKSGGKSGNRKRKNRKKK